MRSISSPSSSKGIAAVVGVGPKLGCSIARKFAHEGYTVAILARDLTKLSRLAEEIAREAKAQVFAIRVDCSDSKSVHEAFEGVLSLGFVEILVYNACEPVSCHPTKFTSISLESFERSLAVSAVGAFHCAQQASVRIKLYLDHGFASTNTWIVDLKVVGIRSNDMLHILSKVIPSMVERGRGTIIFTGSSASVNGFAGYCELSCGKFALRGLSQCLAREFQLSGVHVAHVIIDGAIGMPRLSRGDPSTEITMDPDAVAQTYWQIHNQDKSAWTQEIILRSSNQMP